MKQFTLFTIICCLLAGVARAATVSGTVIDAKTNIPVAGQVITIKDSTGTFSTFTATTNSSGVYTATMSPTPPLNAQILISTTACGFTTKYVRLYTGSNITGVNFNLCTGSSNYNLQGTVSLGATANNGRAWVLLIRKQYDTVLLDTTLIVIDSIATAVSGGTFSKSYAAIPSGTLLLKAALQSSHPSYASFLPTYYTSSLVWSSATPLTTLNFISAQAMINMTAGSNPGGPGFIGGSVLVGANKGAAVGDPLGNRILLLTTGANVAVAYTYSDAGGKFSFPGLAYGTYKIFGDAWGKTNPALTLTITATKPSAGNIVFEENNKKFEGHLGGLGTGGIANALAGAGIYPNPVTNQVSISGLTGIGGSKTVTLCDITGRIIIRRSFSGSEPVQVATGNLAAGTYMLQLQTEAGNAVFPMTK